MKTSIISNGDKPIIRLEPTNNKERKAFVEGSFDIGSLFRISNKQPRGVMLMERMFSPNNEEQS